MLAVVMGTSSHLPSVALHPRFRQFRFPAKPYPLLDVVGKAAPEGFHPYLEQPAEMELPEPYLLLDPGMGKFGDGASLFVDLLRPFRFHLLYEGDDCWIRHAPHD